MLRRGVGPISESPGADVQRVLSLQIDPENGASWIDQSANSQFRYLAWSDDTSDEAVRYESDSVRSAGHWLIAKRSAILSYLTAKQMDLIIEVDITRRIGGNSDFDEDDDSKGPTEVQYDRIVVLRRDGSVEAAEGRIGTWSASGSRVKSGRQHRHLGEMDGAPSSGTSRRSRKVS